jgi:hypothetical protein
MSATLLQEMEADTQTAASSVETVNDSGLKSVADLAKEARRKEADVARLENELKAAKKELLEITDEHLPALLAELGLSAFELDDGAKVMVKPTYGAHIKADEKEAAFNWLRSNGFGDLIKNTVSCSFGRGEDEEALQFMEQAQRAGFAAEQKTEVHPSTLKAWVKERVENGEEFPTTLFGAYVGQRATIKGAK